MLLNDRSILLLLIIIFIQCHHAEFTLFGLNGAIDKNRLKDFTLPNVSPECFKTSSEYVGYIVGILQQNATATPDWALKMIDATAKIPTGILEGNLKWLGSFTECLRINNDGVFSGQYCTATISNSLIGNTSSSLNNLMGKMPIPSESIGKLLSCNCVTFGICWPSICNQSEIQQLINYAALPLVLQSNSCQIQTLNNYDAGTISVITLFCLFGMILVIGTAFEVLLKLKFNNRPTTEELTKPGFVRQFLLSFSLLKNGKKILNTHNNSESMTCIHGIRLLSFFWVVLGHTYDYAVNMAIKNPLDINSTLQNAAFDVILNGTYSVDTFLFISGFLITYVGLKQIKKAGGRLNIFLYYFHRFWRLTPVYAMVIAFIAGPYYLMGSGPQWPTLQSSARYNCRNYWWRNLLYINNLYDTAHICVDVSWYLSIDMQYYIIMPFVLLLLYKKPNYGFGAVGILFLVTILTPALYIHYHDIPGYSSLQILFDGASPKALDYQSNVYIKPWCRMGPYLVGVCLGYFLYKKELRVKLKWWGYIIGWVLATGLGLTLIYGTYSFFDGDKIMNNAQNSVYGALSRPAWGLCVAWVVFACVTGYGGFVNTLLSWKGMIPLSRLTYCGYLLHLYILVLLFDTQEVPYYFQQYLMVIIYCGFLVVVMGVSFIFSITFEAPMMELEKVIFKQNTQKMKARQSMQKLEKQSSKTITTNEGVDDSVPYENEQTSHNYENEAYVVTEENEN